MAEPVQISQTHLFTGIGPDGSPLDSNTPYQLSQPDGSLLLIRYEPGTGKAINWHTGIAVTGTGGT